MPETLIRFSGFSDASNNGCLQVFPLRGDRKQKDGNAPLSGRGRCRSQHSTHFFFLVLFIHGPDFSYVAPSLRLEEGEKKPSESGINPWPLIPESFHSLPCVTSQRAGFQQTSVTPGWVFCLFVFPCLCFFDRQRNDCETASSS